LPELFFCGDPSALPLAGFPARHDDADVTQGRIWGQGDAPPLGFMKAASETQPRAKKYINTYINILRFSLQRRYYLKNSEKRNSSIVF